MYANRRAQFAKLLYERTRETLVAGSFMVIPKGQPHKSTAWSPASSSCRTRATPTSRPSRSTTRSFDLRESHAGPIPPNLMISDSLPLPRPVTRKKEHKMN